MNGRPRRTGGRGHGMGTPQGGVISPLLANVYMHRFLRAWRERGMDRHLKAKVVSYADDFVILCRGTAVEALAVTHRWMRVLKLTLNEKKTRVCDATQTPFDFLGYTFGPTVHRPTGRTYLAAQPSRKATARLRDRVRAILRPGNQAPWPEVVRQVNRVVSGWHRYFWYGTVSRALSGCWINSSSSARGASWRVGTNSRGEGRSTSRRNGSSATTASSTWRLRIVRKAVATAVA